MRTITTCLARRSVRSAWALALALPLGACAPAAPDTPTWARDVQPIMMANCVRCHASPGRGNISGLRFDLFASGAIGAVDWIGADLESNAAAERAGRSDPHSAPMPPPPSPLLDEFQRETLIRWNAQRGDDDIPELGSKPGNRAPVVTKVVEPPSTADALVKFELLVLDPDGDGVVGPVRYGPTDDEIIDVIMHSGTTRISWDTSVLAPGSYTITADIRDDLDTSTTTLGTVTIAHP